MGRVIVLILHPAAPRDGGPLVRELAGVRLELAGRLAGAARAAGADEVRLLEGSPDDTPFGARLRSLARPLGAAGLVVLGSGSLPLATVGDLRAFVAAAASGAPLALANGRYSADVVALGRADLLADVPDLASDNALPRWLAEVAGVEVRSLDRRWRLAVDIDSPLDVVLAGAAPGASAPLRSAGRRILAGAPVLGDRLRAVARAMADRRAEILVAGRTSALTLRWLERRTASRTRALVEERGLRAADPSGLAQRPPASVLDLLLRVHGPTALGDLLPGLADAALIDTRVLLAARLGADERGWPTAEDRFASDLLRPEAIADPPLRELTASAAKSRVPILLGGHTLVGPGLRLVPRAAGMGWAVAARSGESQSDVEQPASASR